MGGGTPIVEANRVGCNVIGFDINPMSYWIVKQELEYLDLVEYAEAADSLRSKLEKSIGGLYRTRCGFCGSNDAHVKYFIWCQKASLRPLRKGVRPFFRATCFRLIRAIPQTLSCAENAGN